MPEPKKIWTGTWMGIAAHVEMIGGVPVPFLAGRRAQFEADVHGILGAAVVGLAAERDGMRAERDGALVNLGELIMFPHPAELLKENDTLRDRLAKLEAGLAEACDGWEYASQYKGDFLVAKHGDVEDIAKLRKLLKGSANVETSKI